MRDTRINNARHSECTCTYSNEREMVTTVTNLSVWIYGGQCHRLIATSESISTLLTKTRRGSREMFFRFEFSGQLFLSLVRFALLVERRFGPFHTSHLVHSSAGFFAKFSRLIKLIFFGKYARKREQIIPPHRLSGKRGKIFGF